MVSGFWSRFILCWPRYNLFARQASRSDFWPNHFDDQPVLSSDLMHINVNDEATVKLVPSSYVHIIIWQDSRNLTAFVQFSNYMICHFHCSKLSIPAMRCLNPATTITSKHHISEFWQPWFVCSRLKTWLLSRSWSFVMLLQLLL